MTPEEIEHALSVAHGEGYDEGYDEGRQESIVKVWKHLDTEEDMREFLLAWRDKLLGLKRWKPERGKLE